MREPNPSSAFPMYVSTSLALLVCSYLLYQATYSHIYQILNQIPVAQAKQIDYSVLLCQIMKTYIKIHNQVKSIHAS